MLDDLVARFGLGAIVNAAPYVGKDGETIRWVIEIDYDELPDVDVRVVEDHERDHAAAFLVHGEEEVELDHWRPSKLEYGPASIVRTLRELATLRE